MPAAASLTLWLDAEGQWHASVVLPDGEYLEFVSPFELALCSRGVIVERLPSGTRLR